MHSKCQIYFTIPQRKMFLMFLSRLLRLCLNWDKAILPHIISGKSRNISDIYCRRHQNWVLRHKRVRSEWLTLANLANEPWWPRRRARPFWGWSPAGLSPSAGCGGTSAPSSPQSSPQVCQWTMKSTILSRSLAFSSDFKNFVCTFLNDAFRGALWVHWVSLWVYG